MSAENSARRRAARSSFASTLVAVLGLACEPPAEKAHPGCPGESFRSASSETDCVCSGDDVLRAGNLECESCDPVRSGGSYCACAEPGVFSFDSSLNTALGLRSEQVTCSPRSECPEGQRSAGASGACEPCDPLECGATCGACPVGLSCVSGQCAPVSVCVIEAGKKRQADGTEDPFYTCGLVRGDVKNAVRQSGLPRGARCDFVDPDGCHYSATLEPLIPVDVLHRGCPGESSSKSGVCACPSGKVLTAGTLECADCEPKASGGAYCDCGENAVFSFDGRINAALGVLSEQVRCQEPSECPEGERRAALDPTECVPCAADECGSSCGLCEVGSTCISGKCVAAAACRVDTVIPLSPDYPCGYGPGDLAGFGSLASVPNGARCTVAPGDGCQYEGVSEVLSK